MATAVVLALPLFAMAPAAAATPFTASFEPTAANEWWVQVKVSASSPLAGVDARVNAGSWKPLTLKSYGWAASMSAPAGSIVQFQARDSSGGSAVSGCYQWTSRASVTCAGGSTPAPAPAPAPSGATTFTPKGGSEWWVQVKISGAPTKVEARDTDGAWTALSLKSWGDWAASFHVEAGHQVQYRATLPGGAVATSCWFAHPASTSCAAAPGTSGSGTPPAPSPSPSPSGSLLWKDSFEKSPWTSPWAIKSIWGTQNFAVVKESGSKVPTFLRVSYPAGSGSPALEDSAGAPKGGGEFKGTLGISPRDSLAMRYDVRFPVGFDFVRGGKLPGLYGGTGPSGGQIPNGADGWSTRLMWRPNGAGEVYAYLPTSQTWGTEIGTGNWQFKADGQWHRVEQQVILNTPGSSNGEIKIWYDGAQVVHATGLKFRTTTSLKVDGIFFSTFFGGSDASWATPKSVHADFGNFQVSTGHIGT